MYTLVNGHPFFFFRQLIYYPKGFKKILMNWFWISANVHAMYKIVISINIYFFFIYKEVLDNLSRCKIVFISSIRSLWLLNYIIAPFNSCHILCIQWRNITNYDGSGIYQLWEIKYLNYRTLTFVEVLSLGRLRQQVCSHFKPGF